MGGGADFREALWVCLGLPTFSWSLTCGSQAWPWAETHTCCSGAVEGVSGEHSTPEAGCPRGSPAGGKAGCGRQSLGSGAAPHPHPPALPLLLRHPGPAHLRDLLPRGAEGHREGLCHLRGPHGEGGAPQLGQQGGEGEGTTARPSLALPLLSSWGGLGARRPYPGRAVAPGQQGLSLLASVAPLSLRPTQKGQVH